MPDALGTPIPLVWDSGGPPEWWVVYGHGQHEAAERHARSDLWEWAADAPRFDDCTEEEIEEEVAAWRLPTEDGWARWVDTSSEEAKDLGLEDDWPRALVLCGEEDPGAFRVTIAHDGEEEDYVRGLQEAEAARMALAQDLLAARWPGATLAHAWEGGAPPVLRVEFHAPGCRGPARWVPSTDRVTVWGRTPWGAWAEWLTQHQKE